MIKVDGLQKYIEAPGSDEVKGVMIEVISHDDSKVTLIAHCDEGGEVEASEMNCCQPTEATTAACVVDLETNCPEGYSTMENEWVDPNDEYNCVGYAVGYSTPTCEDLGLEEETTEEEEVEVACNTNDECAEGEICEEGFCVAEEEEEVEAVE